jgi:hypothetical protein
MSGQTPTKALSPPTRAKSTTKKRTRAGKAKDVNGQKEEELGVFFQTPQPSRPRAVSPAKSGFELWIKVQRNRAECRPENIKARHKEQVRQDREERRLAGEEVTPEPEPVTKQVNGQHQNNQPNDSQLDNNPQVAQPTSSNLAISNGDATAIAIAASPTPTPVTPSRFGWGLSSIVGWFTGKKAFADLPPTPVANAVEAAAPATAPAVVLVPKEVEEFRDALTPTPSRVQAPTTVNHRALNKFQPAKTARFAKTRKNTKNTQTAASTRTTMKSKRRVADPRLVERILQSIPHEKDRISAKPWVEENLIRLGAGSGADDKLRRLDHGMKMSELDEIPSRYPWDAQISFGYLEEFFDDDSDEDEDFDSAVPVWYVLDLIVNERPSKKRKSAHNIANDLEITPLNEFAANGTFDSHGNSASHLDLHPRPSCVPSPMFSKSGNSRQPTVENVPKTSLQTPTPSRNLFSESTLHTPRPESNGYHGFKDKNAFDAELRRTGHVEGSGDFCMPDFSDSDSDDEGEDTHGQDNTDPAWLQQSSMGQETDNQDGGSLKPPPAPIPSHATLPNPITTRPNIPPVAREDPVKEQRARAMKHTPAKPSRLREAMLPSPSIASEAGSPSAGLVNIFVDGVPEPVAFDLGDPDLDEMISSFAMDQTTPHKVTDVWGDDELMLMDDDDDEL